MSEPEFDIERELSLAVLAGHQPVLATTEAELHTELVSWIEYRFGVTGGAVRMTDLNRRFGVTVRRLGLTCAQVIRALVLADQVLTFEYKRNALLVPRAEYTRLLDRLSADIEAQGKFREGVLTRAFGVL